MAGSGVTLYANNAAGNKAIVGTIDWRENVYMPSQINDNLAQIMADIRAMANSVAGGWIEIGDGDGTYTATYVSATSFQFSGIDVTPYYRAGMRVRVVAPTPGTIAGTITAVAFTTNTLITVVWDSGAGLSNEAITSVFIGVGSSDAMGRGTRHDCRLDFVSSSTIRLNRYGGSLITIDAQAQTIPVAGVDLALNVGWPLNTLLYVYAGMVSGVMGLTVVATAPATDPRDGNSVMTGNAATTLVGAIVVDGTGFLQSATRRGVYSAWNRKGFALSASYSNIATTSTTPVAIAGPLILVSLGDEPVTLLNSGYATNSAGGQWSGTDIQVNGAASGGLTLSITAVANYANNSGVGITIAPAAAGLLSCLCTGQVSGGASTGTWTGIFTLTSRG